MSRNRHLDRKWTRPKRPSAQTELRMSASGNFKREPAGEPITQREFKSFLDLERWLKYAELVLRIAAEEHTYFLDPGDSLRVRIGDMHYTWNPEVREWTPAS